MQQLWHLWPHTKQHLYLCIAAVLALYLHTSDDATALRCGTIVAVSVLPASAHAPAAVVASMLLPPIDAGALPRYLQILLALAVSRRPHSSSRLERAQQPAVARVARRRALGAGAAVGRTCRALEPLGQRAGLRPFRRRACGHAARRQNEDRAFPYLAGQYYAAHLASALAASVLALLDRRAPTALPGAPVGAVAVRELGAADARGRRGGAASFPLFALAAACEALRGLWPTLMLCTASAGVFQTPYRSRPPASKRSRSSAPPSRPACSSRAGSGRRNWCRAPARRSGRSCATGGTATKRSGSVARGPSWAASTRRMIQGEKVDVDLEGAPGRWRRARPHSASPTG